MQIKVEVEGEIMARKIASTSCSEALSQNQVDAVLRLIDTVLRLGGSRFKVKEVLSRSSVNQLVAVLED